MIKIASYKNKAFYKKDGVVYSEINGDNSELYINPDYTSEDVYVNRDNSIIEAVAVCDDFIIYLKNDTLYSKTKGTSSLNIIETNIRALNKIQ